MKTTKLQTSKELLFKKPRLTLNRLLGITYILVALIILLSGVKFWLLSARYDALFDQGTYQAVTLSNGQTFFGHLARYGMNTYVLTDVFYLQRTSAQTTETTENADATQEQKDENTEKNDSGLSLQPIIKDLHQPANYMVLNRDQIVFWQNLNSNSPIIETIQKSKETEDTK